MMAHDGILCLSRSTVVMGTTKQARLRDFVKFSLINENKVKRLQRMAWDIFWQEKRERGRENEEGARALKSIFHVDFSEDSGWSTSFVHAFSCSFFLCNLIPCF